MFIDKVDIYVRAGNGGNGCVSFRREKYVAKGGPDGGDGGRGGNVVFRVAEGENTLLDYKYRHKFVAKNGGDGSQKKFHGKNGEDTVLRVPAGTVIRDKQSGKVIHDMSDGKDFVVCHGGKGGWGNTHFATATRQVPHFARSGRDGEEAELTLELKMIADIGLVGYPNVGKSTLLTYISSARPKIANYHFTTLSPNLGVVTVYDKRFVVADIPGLIEGASDGAGLGHDFLRHIERCRLIAHVFDISASERPDPLEDIKVINRELKKFSPEIAALPQILVGNKTDNGYSEDDLKRIKAYAARRKEKLFLICGGLGEGVDELLKAFVEALSELPPPKIYEREFFQDMTPSDSDEIAINVVNGVYEVAGERLKRLCRDINFDNRESLQYFQRTLKNTGVIEALENKGIKEGDTVSIYGIEFDFVY